MPFDPGAAARATAGRIQNAFGAERAGGVPGPMAGLIGQNFANRMNASPQGRAIESALSQVGNRPMMPPAAGPPPIAPSTPAGNPPPQRIATPAPPPGGAVVAPRPAEPMMPMTAARTPL